MIKRSDAANALHAAGNAIIVLDWVNHEAARSNIVIGLTCATLDSLAAAFERAPSLPGVKDSILQAMKNEAEDALIKAGKVLEEYSRLRGTTLPPSPPGFSGIDDA